MGVYHQKYITNHTICGYRSMPIQAFLTWTTPTTYSLSATHPLHSSKTDLRRSYLSKIHKWIPIVIRIKSKLITMSYNALPDLVPPSSSPRAFPLHLFHLPARLVFCHLNMTDLLFNLNGVYNTSESVAWYFSSVLEDSQPQSFSSLSLSLFPSGLQLHIC